MKKYFKPAYLLVGGVVGGYWLFAVNGVVSWESFYTFLVHGAIWYVLIMVIYLNDEANG